MLLTKHGYRACGAVREKALVLHAARGTAWACSLPCACQSHPRAAPPPLSCAAGRGEDSEPQPHWRRAASALWLAAAEVAGVVRSGWEGSCMPGPVALLAAACDARPSIRKAQQQGKTHSSAGSSAIDTVATRAAAAGEAARVQPAPTSQPCAGAALSARATSTERLRISNFRVRQLSDEITSFVTLQN